MYSQAQFISPGGAAVVGQVDYSLGDIPADRLAQLNVEGANGSRLIADEILGGALTNIFANVRAESSTYEYSAIVSSDSSADSLADFNAQGSMSRELVGGFTTGEEETSWFFVEENGVSATYSYELETRPESIAGVQALLDERGANGLVWKAFLRFRDSGGGLESTYLFMRDSTRTGSYSYMVEGMEEERADGLAQFNARGAAGFGYIGGDFLEGGFFNIFANYSDDSEVFAYEFENVVLPRVGFLAQVNAQANRGGVFRGVFAFSSQIDQVNLYERSSAGVVTSSGEITLSSAGVVGFVPAASGTFQLETSLSDLSSWVPLQAAQSGTAGSEITWDTGVPVVGTSRFFRVVTP